MSTTAIADLEFSPADVMRVWNISTGNYDAWKAKKFLDHKTVKTQGGEIKVSRYSVVQMCKVGVQLSAVRDIGLSHGDASSFAKAAAIEIDKLFSGPPIPVGAALNIPYVVITGDKPEWFKVGLNDPVKKIQERIGKRRAVIFDVYSIVEKVCLALAEKYPEEYRKWQSRAVAKNN